MAAIKRTLENPSVPKSKKTKTHDGRTSTAKVVTNPVSMVEVDFPRGGGTSFTPLEVKTFRAEAVKEANEELFEDARPEAKKSKKRKRKSDGKRRPSTEKSENIRIEHLNYKRLTIGMKIFGRVVAVEPLALIVSLPNQLFAHVPITNISIPYTGRLEAEADKGETTDEEEDEGEEAIRQYSRTRLPDLGEMFHSGEYIRAVVTAVHPPGSTATTTVGKSRDEVSKASRRVELSLSPEKVNAGVKVADLKSGFTLSTAIKSVEDHGYILDLGLPEVSGFLSFKDATQPKDSEQPKLHTGGILNVTVSKLSTNKRTCHVTLDRSTFSSTVLSEVSAVSSVLPGTLVHSLITAVQPNGLNLQILGFFEGTIDDFHLRRDPSNRGYKVGKKIKARVLYSFSSTPPRFALSINEHILDLGFHQQSKKPIDEAYPIGTILESVEVVRVEPEHGLAVKLEPGTEGFIHISHISDEHHPSIATSGPWKVGTLHRARVTGYHPFDGLVQLSMKASVLEQQYLQLGDIQVGELIKGTIKKLTDLGLFVSVSGNIDGVVWPNHYADIILKHPAKRFKVGASIKCRVLVVDLERRRISLTAKKTLLESTLPIISKMEDVRPGVLAHAVVFKTSEKHLMVEFYNNLKAVVPAKEASENAVTGLASAFPVGRVVKVRIIRVEAEERHIVASVRQASVAQPVVVDIAEIGIGDTVEGTVSDVHKEHAMLTLQPSGARALLSLKNIANHRSIPLAQLRTQLKAGENFSDLLVVTRNPEKSLVIVANKPKPKATTLSKSLASIEVASIGQLVGGRVTRHTRHGTLVKISSHVKGILHPTDTADNFENTPPYPPLDSVLKVVVIGIDTPNKRLIISTRHSKIYPDKPHEVTDREICDLTDLKIGETIRGFIKSVAEHGLFVNIGRGIDARVQIRELFDEYIKDWKPKFQVNKLVKGKIISVNLDTKQVEMSFRSKSSSSNLTIQDLQVGQIVQGIVKRIEDYGLFIQIEGSKLNGLCHKSELADNQDADATVALQGFRQGDQVKAFISAIEERRISLSLKPSHFAGEDLAGERNQEPEYVEAGRLGVHKDDEKADGVPSDQEDGAPDDSDSDESAEIHINEESLAFPTHQTTSASLAPLPAPTITISGGFQWKGNSEPQDTSIQASSDEDTDEEAPRKKRRKRKEIEQDLTADLHTKAPESTADFERLLLGSPSSSYLWIQYMSFQIQLSEVDKAREIARRAIQTIDFREEQEKLNVWIALLNLEIVYGGQETLDATFKEAARANDSKTVHLRFASILDQASLAEKAEAQYQRTCKKFSRSSKVWTLFGDYHLRRGNLEDARKLLQRSLLSLEKRKHLKTISRFAQLEYKHGEAERGKTLFEGIVDSHPKRWDLWSIYMDMEAGQQDIQSLRNLFDRVLALKMTSHKAKAFFKKWLDLEKRLGDEEGASAVKQKAIEWTQKANSS